MHAIEYLREEMYLRIIGTHAMQGEYEEMSGLKIDGSDNLPNRLVNRLVAFYQRSALEAVWFARADER